MAELALGDDERHAFMGHLDRMGVAELVWRDSASHSCLGGDAAQLSWRADRAVGVLD